MAQAARRSSFSPHPHRHCPLSRQATWQQLDAFLSHLGRCPHLQEADLEASTARRNTHQQQPPLQHDNDEPLPSHLSAMTVAGAVQVGHQPQLLAM